MSNNVLDAIFSRRSIRKFTEQAVEEEKITQLLQAGMAAPSARNGQPWEFVVVTEEKQMDALKQAMPFGRHNSVLRIVVCGNPRVSTTPTSSRYFWVQDCSAAIENMLIAAVGLGLGAVWCGIHPITILKKRVRAVLKLPEHVTPLGMLEFGYPAEVKEPRTQYDEKRVHWQAYKK